MNFQTNCIYHIYNQGNNKQQLFYSVENYLYSLRLFREYVLPHCDVMAYCLMTNHFHFLINANQQSVVKITVGSLELSALSNGFRLLQSTYAQAINKQENRTGSLFRQKTKAKCLEFKDVNYPFVAFNYIHQNPFVADLVKTMEEWVFSSFKDFALLRNGSICNKQLALQLIGYDEVNFYSQSYKAISEEYVKKIY